MLKTLYVVTFHSYWEHYNAKPTTTEYETKEEAVQAMNDYERRWFMEDGYYTTLHTKKRVVITAEDERKREERKLLKAKPFNYKKDAYAYGIYKFWDGSKEIFFITKNPEEHTMIYFLQSKVVYRLAETIDFFRAIAYPYASSFRGSGMWCMDTGEEMTILGGQIFLLPSSCQEIRTIKVERNIDNLM